MEMNHKALRKITPTLRVNFNITMEDFQCEPNVAKQSHGLGLDIERDICKDIAPVECVIEVYHCAFCKFEDAMRSRMENHYYFNHAFEIEGFEGSFLSRRIDILITNGEKSFVKSFMFSN